MSVKARGALWPTPKPRAVQRVTDAEALSSDAASRSERRGIDLPVT